MKQVCVWCMVLLGLWSSCLSPDQKLLRNNGYREGIFARIITDKGEMIALLEYEKVPLTVANFIGLSEGSIPNEFRKPGKSFYDSLKFHRVIAGVMLIAGCPKGDGSGHPGYLFQDEFHPDLKHDRPGILSMQNYGPVTNGSQFIISLQPNPELDGKHPVFGRIISGMNVALSIQQGDMIRKVSIIRQGKKAHKFNPLRVFFEKGFTEMLKR